MSRRAKWLLTSLAVAAAFLALAAVVIFPIMQRRSGNYPIAFYGRVVDAEGNPVPDVRISFKGFYTPVLQGRGEKPWTKTVTTDRGGNFTLTGVYGYSVRFDSATTGGTRVGLTAEGLRPERNPLYGVRMDEKVSHSKLPDTPQKRIVCKIVPLK